MSRALEPRYQRAKIWRRHTDRQRPKSAIAARSAAAAACFLSLRRRAMASEIDFASRRAGWPLNHRRHEGAQHLQGGRRVILAWLPLRWS